MKLKLTKDPLRKGYYQDAQGNLYVFRFGGRPIKVDGYREDKPRENVQVDSVEVDRRQIIDHRKEAPIADNKIFIKEAEKEYEERESKIKSEKSDTEKNHLESLQRDLVHEINNTEKRADLEYNSMIDAVEQVNARGGYHSKEELYDDLAGSLGITTEEAKKVWDEKHSSDKKDKFKYLQEFSMKSPVNDLEAAQNYLTEDDMTQYLPENLKEKINKVEWQLNDESSGEIVVMANNELSEEEENELYDWIEGQNSDGLGEGFEQQEFAESYYDPNSGDGPYTRYEAEEEINRRIEEMDSDDYVNYLDDYDVTEATKDYLKDGYYNQSFEDYLLDKIEELGEEDPEEIKSTIENTPEESLYAQYSEEYDEWVEEEKEDFLRSSYLEDYLNEDAISDAKSKAAMDDTYYNVDEWYNMSSMRTYNKDLYIEEVQNLNQEVDEDDSLSSMSKNEITHRIFSRYPDVSEEDEDYLNSLSHDELIKEVKNRGWNLEDEEIEEHKHAGWELYSDDPNRYGDLRSYNEKMQNWQGRPEKEPEYVYDKGDYSSLAIKDKKYEVLESSNSAFGTELYKLKDEEGNIFYKPKSEVYGKAEKESNENLTLMNRYSGTISTLQELHPEWSMAKIMDKIKKLEED